MSWRWEDFTAPAFARAVEEVNGVCLLPLGVMEKHGEHLPLGTDSFAVEEVAQRAVAIEPAIVFPRYYLTQIQEAKQCPGSLAIDPDLMIALLDNICDEIARNGMHKIILLNGHGGNETWLSYFAMRMFSRPRDFTLYIARLGDYMSSVNDSPEWKAMMVSKFDYHGGEIETSIMLGARPDLVRMEDIAEPGIGKGKLKHLPRLITPTWWYAEHPGHYAGDATPATAEKGEFLLDGYAKNVAAIIKAVREDEVAPALEAEYFAQSQH